MNTAHAHHITPIKIYLAVAIALLTLTFITVVVAQFDFGAMNMVVAMAVAGIKATLVGLFFMHLFYDNKIYMIVFVASLLFLSIFIIITMYDTMRRDAIYSERAGPIKSDAIIYQSPPGAVADSVISDTTAQNVSHSEEK